MLKNITIKATTDDDGDVCRFVPYRVTHVKVELYTVVILKAVIKTLEGNAPLLGWRRKKAKRHSPDVIAG